MNRRIRCRDLNGAQTADFEEIAAGDWRGVDAERSAGLCIYTWETLITRVADLIGGGYGRKRYIDQIEVSDPAALVQVDQVGNTWIDHEYLAPHQYLPRLIPEKPA
jgi:hypothetical protein